jgi:hypothetical protein
MSRVAFRVFPAGRVGDTRVAICAVAASLVYFVCMCVCLCSFGVGVGALERRKKVGYQSQLFSGRGPQKPASPAH